LKYSKRGEQVVFSLNKNVDIICGYGFYVSFYRSHLFKPL